MSNVTVTCQCRRQMTEVGNAPKGTFKCGCGARVVVVVANNPQCASFDGDIRCRNVPSAASRIRFDLALCTIHEKALETLLATVACVEHMDVAEDDPHPWFTRMVAQTRHELASAPAKPMPSVVYYARFGDQIKIGFSTHLAWRMSALDPDELLAAEPGGRTLENSRHKQFADLRIPGKGDRGERFRAGPELMAHISAIRAEHGPPYLVAD